jgi:hypothetical protein
MALSVGLSGADTSMPFEINLPSTSPVSAELVLAALNETSNTQKVLAWQMSLQLLPRPGTTGSLLFESTAPAQDSLFGPNPGPRSNLSSPNSQITVADANSVTFSGQPVEPDVPRNIVELNLIAAANTKGSYELVLRKFDPENPTRRRSGSRKMAQCLRRSQILLPVNTSGTCCLARFTCLLPFFRCLVITRATESWMFPTLIVGKKRSEKP